MKVALVLIARDDVDDALLCQDFIAVIYIYEYTSSYN